jgi:hypothetical protein
MDPDLSGFCALPLINCHVHHWDSSLIPDVVSLMDAIGIVAINVVSTPHPEHVNLNPQALEFKARHPERVYVFGGLDYSELTTQGSFATDLADQVAVLQDLGCDGIKMIEGKPAVRKRLPLPRFDAPEYQEYFAQMEARGFPLLFHVADPDRLWDEELVPPVARARGRFYGDDPAFPTKEQLYAEVGHVLERHPHLRVIFAHFYFLSADLPRMAALLDIYPNVHLDIAPGSGMYANFSRQPEAAPAGGEGQVLVHTHVPGDRGPLPGATDLSPGTEDAHRHRATRGRAEQGISRQLPAAGWRHTCATQPPGGA